MDEILSRLQAVFSGMLSAAFYFALNKMIFGGSELEKKAKTTFQKKLAIFLIYFLLTMGLGAIIVLFVGLG